MPRIISSRGDNVLGREWRRQGKVLRGSEPPIAKFTQENREQGKLGEQPKCTDGRNEVSFR